MLHVTVILEIMLDIYNICHLQIKRQINNNDTRNDIDNTFWEC